MEESKPIPPVCFIGDLGDEWVSAIADALPPGSVSVDLDSVAELSEITPPVAECLVLHRSHLSFRGEACLKHWRETGLAHRVVLIVGPYGRHADLQRWSPLADVVLWDATAREVVFRQASGAESSAKAPSVAAPRVGVISSLYELRMTLTQMCLAAGYSVDPSPDWDRSPLCPLAVWDVPLLEPNWPERLASAAAKSKVVAIMGFADRAAVSLAYQAGASACLDSPCDPDDLAFVLHRLAAQLPLVAERRRSTRFHTGRGRVSRSSPSKAGSRTPDSNALPPSTDLA